MSADDDFRTASCVEKNEFGSPTTCTKTVATEENELRFQPIMWCTLFLFLFGAKFYVICLFYVS